MDKKLFANYILGHKIAVLRDMAIIASRVEAMQGAINDGEWERAEKLMKDISEIVPAMAKSTGVIQSFA